MKKLSLVCAALVVAMSLALGASTAQARSSWFLGINAAPAYYGPAYYYAPPPPPPPPAYYYRYHRPYYPAYYGYAAPVGFSFGYFHR